jgi:spore coat protein A, manganese oxidase
LFVRRTVPARGNGITLFPGQTFILHSNAAVPFPGGPPQSDFYPGNPDLVDPPAPGFSPNTRTLLQFRVVPLGAITGDRKPDKAAADWSLPPSPMPPLPATPARELALYETVDDYGRLAQNLGTLFGPMGYNDSPTEVCQAGTVEIWKIYNLTADTHPIHFHYVNVRVLERRALVIGPDDITTPVVTGDVIPPEPDELGWKETVRMNPAECITLLVDVPLTTGLAPDGVTIPDSPRLKTVGTPGAEYVWHCHILEHEEHDMMRPLVIQASAPKPKP